ncbi:DUF3472 domain-containing protein [Roseiconus nitratireducens]|uniref:DUF3472 domain-containing protein n=1 Tax=Roseiconus nitratireducens TaxID=2605748 RepID=A0A5M6DHI4_9BACT|nr:DUF3472 domain-containing protein [Roseiconus nitratireducens]KAA5545846.1 DUF3472 domain-containing protein [Roseiconus nitratireducens]
MYRNCALVCLCLGLPTVGRSAELTVPASTAYLQPDPAAAKVSPRGIRQWSDPGTTVCWYGEFREPGKLNATVTIEIPNGQTERLELTIAGTTHVAKVTGTGDDPIDADFGEFEIAESGYQQLTLKSDTKPGQNIGTVRSLKLSGPAVENAHFNLDPRRNASSVHLMYPVSDEVEISAFYCEVTAVEDPIWTFYMACGWHRGYFGMQVNSPTERRIIFSVWDSGNEAIDRDKVEDKDRVTLVDKGEDVYTGDFGNEGTGGHSHLKFSWKTGQKQRFLVTAEPEDETFTVYSGYYYRNDLNRWMLISSWKAPHEGGYLRRPHSFSENFVGANGNLRRKALYGNQWIRTSRGDWIELNEARFSHDPTGRENRRDRFMGVEKGDFFLSQGGFVEGFTEFGTAFARPKVGATPDEATLPPLPAAIQ